MWLQCAESGLSGLDAGGFIYMYMYTKKVRNSENILRFKLYCIDIGYMYKLYNNSTYNMGAGASTQAHVHLKLWKQH